MCSVCAKVSAVVGAMLMSAAAMGVTNPFTETFSSAGANWSSAGVFTGLTYPASGGPDGSGYGSSSVSFSSGFNGEQRIVFRGQSEFGSSGNAFVGDWLAAGVNEFSFSV